MIAELQSTHLQHCVLLTLVASAGVGSVADPRRYLEHSEKSIATCVETMPPTGYSQPIPEKGREYQG